MYYNLWLKVKKFYFPKVGVYYVEQPENKHQTNDFLNFWVENDGDAWKAHNWIDTYNFRKKGYKRKKLAVNHYMDLYKYAGMVKSVLI